MDVYNKNKLEKIDFIQWVNGKVGELKADQSITNTQWLFNAC
jgi:hypothetical protein